MGQAGLRVRACYVIDCEANRGSASPGSSRLLCSTLRHYAPSWDRYGAWVGPSATEDVGEWYYRISPVDQEIRYANKIAALASVPLVGLTEGDWVLFLDSDVILCREPSEVTKVLSTLPEFAIVGVQMDYPSEPTREGFARPVFSACGLPFPTERVDCSMYGGKTYPVINSGVLFVRANVVHTLASRWLDFFLVARDLPTLRSVQHYTEQLTLMPAVSSLGLKYHLLPANYNWNGTIAPAANDCVFLHYHRSDILSSDPIARRVREEVDGT